MSVTFDPDDFVTGHGVHPALDKYFRSQRFIDCDVTDLPDVPIADRLKAAALDELYRTEPIPKTNNTSAIIITALLLFVIGGAAWILLLQTSSPLESRLIVTPLPSFVGTTVGFENPLDNPNAYHYEQTGDFMTLVPNSSPTANEIEPESADSGSPSPSVYRITCYCAPDFPESAITASGLTIANARRIAEEMGLQGICAVSPDTPWYANRKDANQVLQVEGHGLYLVCDCTADWIHRTIDIYGCGDGEFCEERQVIDITGATR